MRGFKPARPRAPNLLQVGARASWPRPARRRVVDKLTFGDFCLRTEWVEVTVSEFEWEEDRLR